MPHEKLSGIAGALPPQRREMAVYLPTLWYAPPGRVRS